MTVLGRERALARADLTIKLPGEKIAAGAA